MHHASPQSPGRILLSLASLLLLGASAQADPINLNYSTSMYISDIGRTGTDVLGYAGVSGATVTTDATTGFGSTLNPLPTGMGTGIPLGEIAVSLPTTSGPWSTTYNDTPFYLTISINSVNGDTNAAMPSTYIVDGFLTGVISSNGPSSLTATFVTPGALSSSFPAGTIASISSGGYDTFLSIPSSTTSIGSPDGPVAGLSLAGLAVGEQAVPTPEPSSLVVLGLLGLAQFGVFRLRARRRGRLAA